MLFGADSRGPKEALLEGVRLNESIYDVRGDKMAMLPFVKIL